MVYRGEEEIDALWGGVVATTNNQMELRGVIQALRWLEPSRPAITWSESQYVVRGCAEWRHGWRKKNWTRGKAALANANLWQILDGLLDARIVDVRWTRGHVGTVGNERADELAELGRQSVLSDAGRAGSVDLAQSGGASEADACCARSSGGAHTVRAGERRRGRPVVERGERRVGAVQELIADDASPVLIKRSDPAVAAIVSGGAK